MKGKTGRDPRALLVSTAVLGCCLMAAIVASSAYLRLTSIGIGCEPWPECYGKLATLQTTGIDLGTATGIARLLHRVSAMAVAFVVVFTLVLALARAPRNLGNVLMTIGLAVLTLVLAVVGRQSAGTVVPLIGLINLVGGFTMLALFGLLWARNRRSPNQQRQHRFGRAWLVPTLIVLALQVALGALVSVTYSAFSCSGLLACEVRSESLVAALAAFAPGVPLAIDANGRVLAPVGAAELQLIHRVLGLGLGGAIVLMGAHTAWGNVRMMQGWRLVVLGGGVAVLGVTMVSSGFALTAALAHNLAAAVLVLVLTTMAAGSYRKAPPAD